MLSCWLHGTQKCSMHWGGLQPSVKQWELGSAPPNQRPWSSTGRRWSALSRSDDWNIYSFHINSTVSSRYATTVITSRVANRMAESKEVEFHVRIPKNAFITKFRMFIDGQVYDGNVKEKEQAQRQYTTAVSRGQSAGIVSSVGRTLEEFKTSVTVSAHNKVTFELTYEELMKRTLGKYELQIHARPMQPVKDFKVSFLIAISDLYKQVPEVTTFNFCVFLARLMCTFRRKLESVSWM
uniref:VIT domain-containing protein n=1 Tax=Salarias fasciatus TaxID=181472 RepID=A0A672FWH2_SALFA